ncbi:competence type IV pilus assembly protein ComGB [Salinibacillus xinjiangensis]|uniref:Type II secretion system protein GspF domain-containing protein n=1 Tax=Salinibacillus xinjiangensis TaxID=1229268 RepID=A0A6G1X6P2_9BACI|nr:competence type IV pilus assembly protein ComGB [Salinibacillus xinjiangensis]MRG86575.1 hypothetical protein [Salinibacillus xinjiangensis]
MLLVLLMNVRFSQNTTLNKKLSLYDQILLSKRLSTLLENGYTINKALQLISLDSKQGQLAAYIEKSLVQGAYIDQIFMQLGFSPIVCSYLFFSRSTGQLGKSLGSASKLLIHQQQFQEKFKRVMQYPLIILLILLCLMISLKFFLLPSLQGLYQDFQTNHSSTSPKIFTSIDVIITTFFGLMMIIVTTITLWGLVKNKLSTSAKINLYRHVPVFRKVKSLETSCLFSFHFSSLLQSGIPIKQALQIISEQRHLPIVRIYATKMIQAIYTGKVLEHTIQEFELMEDELSLIFERSLKDGTLEKDLHNYALLLTETMLEKTTKVLSLIQPAFYLLFGVMIVMIYFSILIPMFDLIQQI